MKVVAVIPALNESGAIGRVVAEIPPSLVDRVVVVDNGSTDDTLRVAALHGAATLVEERRGYGYACMAGIDFARDAGADVVLFLDGDYADVPAEADELLRPIREDRADFVVGSRARGHRQKGAMPLQARFGNWLACTLIRLGWGYRFTDLGPFRAIRLDSLDRLALKEGRYGWTVEMQIRALEERLRVCEVPVSYRRRVGKSKVSGTISGSIKAGFRILLVIARAAGSRTFRDGQT